MSLSTRKNWKTVAVGASCLVAGAGASAISTAGAATSTTPTTPPAHQQQAKGKGGHKGIAGRAVEGTAVVETKNGPQTVKFNRGFVQSVNGQQLTLREGTKNKTYKTVTLNVPANAKVKDNGQQASLSKVTAGQRASVIQTPKGTFVQAHTPKAKS
ncbi:MAG: hypothetical protein J2O48_13815 [Solirubrobacterales bacterium]|nr:hypothetical protein [Solirubrobacterales bacterium]